MQPLPFSLRRRSDAEALRDDIAPYLHLSPEERSNIVSQLCQWATEQVMARPDGEPLHRFQEPRSAASEALWLRLVDEARHR